MKLLTMLLVTTVLISGTATGQNDRHDQGDWHSNEIHDGFMTTMPAQAVSVDSLVGSNVLNRADNEPVGEVRDIVVDREGKPLAAIVATGGFLGMGDKTVAIDWSRVDVVPNDEDRLFDIREPDEEAPAEVSISTREHQQSTHDPKPDDYVLVIDVSQDLLEDAPEFDSEDWDMP